MEFVLDLTLVEHTRWRFTEHPLIGIISVETSSTDRTHEAQVRLEEPDFDSHEAECY